MDFINGDISKIYKKYLTMAFGSALITSIYSIVDMAMVGQYQGPNGTAALAVVAPVWNIIYSLGLLTGNGGSVLFSSIKGNKNNTEDANTYFTSAVISSILLAIITWILFIVFEDNILIFFGADSSLLTLAKTYLIPILFVLPLFLFNQMLAAFLRNDNDPTLATIGVLSGGIFNMFGDYFFVFTLDMGIFGAGLATAIGSVISFVVMLVHFKKKINTLTLVRINNFFKQFKEIVINGFSTFFIDVAMGLLTILFNKQIMKYLGTDALSVYGIVINISTFVQCCAYSAGQASQPILSINYGAKKYERVKETLKYAIYTVIVFSVFWTALSEIVPNVYISIFMKPTEEILNISSSIIRTYALSFILLPFNIFSTYYFQAIMQPKIAFLISVLRGFVISGILIIVLPMIFSSSSLWLAMPITECVVMLYVIYSMKDSIHKMKI